MQANDFLLDADGDLKTTSGDFQVGPSDQQHVEDIINSFIGWWKEFSSIGVGIRQYINSSGKEQEIEKSIKIQLKQDGYDVSATRVSSSEDGTLQIAPNAVRN